MNSTHLVRNCSWLASLTCLLWESVSIWPQEYSCIWKCRSSVAKWLYIFSRYFAIAAQITNCALFFGPLSAKEIPMTTCRIWFGFLLGTVLCLYLALEATLAIRVWVLYRQDKMARVCIALALATGMLFNCILNGQTFLKLKYSSQCIAYDPPKAFIYMSVIVAANQALLLLLTRYKKHVAERDGWYKTPVVQVLIRDSAWIFVGMAAIIAAISPYTVKVTIPAHFMLAWPITLIPIMTCRIILNMSAINTPEVRMETDLSTNVAFNMSTFFSTSPTTTEGECLD